MKNTQSNLWDITKGGSRDMADKMASAGNVSDLKNLLQEQANSYQQHLNRYADADNVRDSLNATNRALDTLKRIYNNSGVDFDSGNVSKLGWTSGRLK